VFASALRLWRGPPLADLTYEDAFAQDVSRLEEMRWTCLEDRLEADLADGRHFEVIADLEDLNHRYPLRERACRMLMLAYYRAGRQADALFAYRRMRAKLVGELGLEPSRQLMALERHILQREPALDVPVARSGEGASPAERPDVRTLLAVTDEEPSRLDGLLPLVAPLARDNGAEVVLISVRDSDGGRAGDELAMVTRELSARRARLEEVGVLARVAAFSTPTSGSDLTKFAAHQDVAAIFIDGTGIRDSRRSIASELLVSATCDVVLAFSTADGPSDAAIVVPFGGGEHDWAALELAASFARQQNVPIMLAGAVSRERGDPSRMLATASLILQRTFGVIPEPVMIAPGTGGVLDVAGRAGMLVLGVSARYRTEGVGEMRETIARKATAPTLVVRRGRRPGILAPPDGLTQFGWSLSS
jgi:hypothetical protein